MAVKVSEINTTDYALKCVGALLNLRFPEKEREWNQLLEVYGWGRPTEIREFESAEIPKAVAFRFPGQVWVGVSGTDAFTQVLSYANPVDVRIGSFFDDRIFNDRFDLWGQKVADLIEAETDPADTVFLSGHSYGGAVVTDAAIHLRKRGRRSPIVVTTFGAPKVGGIEYMRPLGTVALRRYVNQGDPIPALPPNEGEFGFPLKIVTRAAAYVLLPHYAYAPGGIMLFPNGDTKLGIEPTLTPSIVAVFSRSQEGIDALVTSPPNHLLAKYGNWLAFRLQRRHLKLLTNVAEGSSRYRLIGETELVAPGSIVRTSDQVDAERIGQFEAIRNQQVAAMLAAAEGLLLQSEGIDVSYVSIPKEALPRPVRIAGNKWMVYWMENPVFGPVTLGNARTFSKKLKWALLRMGSIGPVNETNMLASLAAFLHQATGGGFGWNPSPWAVTT
jgi:hypothetical protein